MSRLRNFFLRKVFPEAFKDVDVQYPLPTDGDSVYAKDVDIDKSDSSGWVGDIECLFGGIDDGLVRADSDNPKNITTYFNRTVITNAAGLGAEAGDFSNLKLVGLLSGGVEVVLYDGTSDSVKRTSQTIQFTPVGIIGLRLEFHTADQVTLYNLVILKTITTVTRLEGQKDDGTVTPIGATNNDNLRVSINEYGDTPAVDAFARLRVSESFTLFDSKQLHDKQPLFWDESIGGSATSVHSSVNAETRMSVTASASDFVIRQTKKRLNYQPGKSQLILMTFHSPQQDGVTARIGAFDGVGANYLTPNNGIFYECDGELSWNICKDGTIEERVTQDQWNVDKLDGTGKSGITLDMEGPQILFVDFEWLGVGRVRVGFVIDGLIYYVHYFNHSNDSTFDSVYMSTPNLPLRYSIESDGSGAGHIDHICSTVISEGGQEKTGVLRSVETRNTYSNTLGGGTGSKHALCGIRLKSTHLDVTVVPEDISIVIDSNDSFKWELHLNPTINGTWTYSDLANSSVQSAQVGAATNNTITADGIIVARGGGSDRVRATSDQLATALRIGSTIDGTADELVLVIGLLTNNQTVWGSLDFRELL